MPPSTLQRTEVMLTARNLVQCYLFPKLFIRFMQPIQRCVSSEASASAVSSSSDQVIPPPTLDGKPRDYPENISKIVESISKLTLLETSQLNDLLKVRVCNIPYSVPWHIQTLASCNAPSMHEVAGRGAVLWVVGHDINRCIGVKFHEKERSQWYNYSLQWNLAFYFGFLCILLWPVSSSWN